MRAKQTSKIVRRVRRHRLALALVAAMAAPAAVAQSLPTGGSVVNGTAGIAEVGNEMTITQSTRGAIINWGTFNIGSGYGVTFNQPTNGVTLNRVLGTLASDISGNLTANGNVFIVNTNGIVFGSSAQVNVGGLVASTLAMSDATFLAGLSSGSYQFSGTTGTPTINNNADINVGSGGLAFVGPTVFNSGALVATGGNIGVGAATTVTLDFVGDGLTQVTLNAAPSVDSGIVQDRFGSMTADGGRILLRTAATAGGTGGIIYASGTLRAQSIANVNGRVELTSVGGAVTLGAPGIFSDASSPFTTGTIDVSGQAGENGGVVLIQGADFVMVNDDDNPLTAPDPLSSGSIIDASGGRNGGQVNIQVSDSSLILPKSSISADGGTGNGGLVRVVANGNNGLLGSTITAGSTAANGGTIGLASSTGLLALADSSLYAGGGANGGVISLFAPQGSLSIDGSVTADGQGGAGGQVTGVADTLLMSAISEINADGATNGGTIGLSASTSFTAYGRLSAHGDGTGGSILTATGGDFDIRGLAIDAGANTTAGLWTLLAPDLNVVSGSDVGPVGGTLLGTAVQDADINYALSTGTSVTLRAGTDPSDFGDIYFNNDVNIFYDDGILPLAFRADAQGSIGGGNFSISSNAAPLSMAFNADANNLDFGFGYIDFFSATFDSNGGDIQFYGQSDTANGVASSYATGVRLQDSTVTTAGGDVLIRGASTGGDASTDDAGVVVTNTPIDAGAGAVTIYGTGDGGTNGVILNFSSITAGAGGVAIEGQSSDADGVLGNASNINATGAISLIGAGGQRGIAFFGGLSSGGGDITLDGSGTAGDGLQASGPVDSAGGDITMQGQSQQAKGLVFGGGSNSGIVSAGGNIELTGDGATAGVELLRSASGPILLFTPADVDTVNSGGGTIGVSGTASAAGAVGSYFDGVNLIGEAGDVSVLGSAVAGTGVGLAGGAGITTTTGAISVTGIGLDVGLALTDGLLSTDSGHFDLRGRGMGASSTGLVVGRSVAVATNGGGIELSGEGGSGAGVELQVGSSIDAGNSLIVMRAGNDGSSDAIRLEGKVTSGLAVNLRPGGVDPNGGLTERVDDAILVGGGVGGFALSGTELGLITSPLLVIGSNVHAGAIQVLGATSRAGDLTLQNDGGSGGIDLQASVDVGGGTLALSSGGDITQTAAAAITAHSLLANAGGSVLLANANNNVASTTLAGSAGGDFEFQDVDALAIGTVTASGFDTSTNGLAGLASNGISAGGDVFVRNLAGDLILNAGVTGANIDLVTANTLQNLAGASLVASGDWRVWANTWVGEARGGLAGDGNLPNLYGCNFAGQCGVTVPAVDNHFIYVQQPTAVVSFDSFTREYGLPNPVFSFSVSGAILGDTAANVASGSGASTATIGSNVGNYPITGSFTSAAGYLFQFVPGTLAITPATLLFTADNVVRYLGTPNPLFTGSISGFRNGDTVQSVFGSGVVWNSPAGILSPIGFYPVNGGTSATNYVFTQAPGNATALQIIPLPQLSSTPIDLIRETINTYVYDRNFGGAPICAVNASLDDQQLASFGDELSNEWSKVRSRPNLTNCFDSERRNSCGDF